MNMMVTLLLAKGMKDFRVFPICNLYLIFERLIIAVWSIGDHQ